MPALPILLASLAVPKAAMAAEPSFVVYRSRSCLCCQAWIAHMDRAGYHAQEVLTDDLPTVRLRYKVPTDLAACHTSVIRGYVFEGHVPAEDVTGFLSQRSEALGLAAPGMPIGSPGMEQADGRREEYFTLLLLGEGRRRIFARH